MEILLGILPRLVAIRRESVSSSIIFLAGLGTSGPLEGVELAGEANGLAERTLRIGEGCDGVP
jgi:hypothetical protein